MSFRTPVSLQGRVLAWVLSGVLALWLGLGLSIGWDASHELDELLDGHLAQAAALLVAQQSAAEPEATERAIDAPTLHRYANKVAFQVFHEGRLVQRSAQAPAAPMLRFEEGFREGLRSTEIDGRRWRVFAAFGAERDVQVYVGERLDSRREILWAVLRGALWPMALSLPLLALAVWWTVRRGTAPLRTLSKTLSQRSALDLAPLSLPQPAPREMQPMLQAMNALFARIHALMQAERRFTADAAHELRLPIAAIRAQAQVALAEPDAGLRQHALHATLLGCDRASRLVEQLLTLARLEAGERPALQTLDLAPLLRQVLADLAPTALQRQQTLSLEEAPAQCLLQGNEPLLAALLRNVVDNALRYSPRGARIELRLLRDEAHTPAQDGWLLQVDDSGPGMSEAELQRLGERFYRVLGHEASGSGLGWTIAQRIAELHSARLSAQRSERLGGLQVRLSGG